MCLVYDEKETQKLLNRFNSLPKEKTTIDFWKVYEKRENILVAIWRWNKIEKPGIVRSDRSSKKFRIAENDITKINKGIHVFTNKKRAEDFAQKHEVVVKVQTRKQDFIAASNQNVTKEAVFMKVEISEKEWNRVFKKER